MAVAKLRVYRVDMRKNPDNDEQALIHEPQDHDPLAEVYAGLVSPDIEEMNEHAQALAEEEETEPESL